VGHRAGSCSRRSARATSGSPIVVTAYEIGTSMLAVTVRCGSIRIVLARTPIPAPGTMSFNTSRPTASVSAKRPLRTWTRPTTRRVSVETAATFAACPIARQCPGGGPPQSSTAPTTVPRWTADADAKLTTRSAASPDADASRVTCTPARLPFADRRSSVRLQAAVRPLGAPRARSLHCRKRRSVRPAAALRSPGAGTHRRRQPSAFMTRLAKPVPSSHSERGSCR